jgi:DNA-binding MarR family transcriptional regulator
MSTTMPGRETTRPGKKDLERLSLFRHRLRCFLRFSELLCARHGITSLQYQLLLHVMGFPGRTWASVGELAERLQAQPHGVVALVDRCEKAGLLERRTGRGDQRVVEIHLLPKGRRLLTTVAAGHRNELRLLMSTFGQQGQGIAKVAASNARRTS